MILLYFEPKSFIPLPLRFMKTRVHSWVTNAWILRTRMNAQASIILNSKVGHVHALIPPYDSFFSPLWAIVLFSEACVLLMPFISILWRSGYHAERYFVYVPTNGQNRFLGICEMEHSFRAFAVLRKIFHFTQSRSFMILNTFVQTPLLPHPIPSNLSPGPLPFYMQSPEMEFLKQKMLEIVSISGSIYR